MKISLLASSSGRLTTEKAVADWRGWEKSMSGRKEGNVLSFSRADPLSIGINWHVISSEYTLHYGNRSKVPFFLQHLC